MRGQVLSRGERTGSSFDFLFLIRLSNSRAQKDEMISYSVWYYVVRSEALMDLCSILYQVARFDSMLMQKICQQDRGVRAAAISS